MAESSVCFSCACELHKSDEIICKGFCRFTFHIKCVGISAEMRNVIATTSRLFWMCDSCTKMMSNASFRQAISNTNTALHNHSSDISDTLHQLRSEIEKNTAHINALLPLIKPCQNITTDIATPLQPTVDSQNTRKRRRTYERTNDTPRANRFTLTGTKEADPQLTIPLARERSDTAKFWLYLSGFSPDATDEQIENLVKRNLNTDTTVEVRKLVPKGKSLSELTFLSFKVGVDLEHRDTAMSSTTWQRGIIFRSFNVDARSARNNFQFHFTPSTTR